MILLFNLSQDVGRKLSFSEKREFHNLFINEFEKLEINCSSVHVKSRRPIQRLANVLIIISVHCIYTSVQCLQCAIVAVHFLCLVYNCCYCLLFCLGLVLSFSFYWYSLFLSCLYLCCLLIFLPRELLFSIPVFFPLLSTLLLKHWMFPLCD